jgi:hypothetical protein
VVNNNLRKLYLFGVVTDIIDRGGTDENVNVRIKWPEYSYSLFHHLFVGGGEINNRLYFFVA